MSNRPSGGRTGPPAHANVTAFRHNKHSKKTQEILKMPISGMCAHCVEVIEWRKKYRKYKPLTAPSKWYARRASPGTRHEETVACARPRLTSTRAPHVVPVRHCSVVCDQRKVKQAYHAACSDCALARSVCAKCLQPRDILPTYVMAVPASLPACAAPDSAANAGPSAD